MAKGYSQVKGVDYQDTFAPTANFTSVRVLMQLAAQHDLILHQMDVKTAYLNAPIDCETFIEQPEGFVVDSGSVVKVRGARGGSAPLLRLWPPCFDLGPPARI